MGKWRQAGTFALLAIPPVVTALCAAYALRGAAPLTVAVWCGALGWFLGCDGWYFIRLAVWSVRELIDNTRQIPQKHLFATSQLHGRVTLTDIDRNAHCNNARYLRECGFGRRHLWHHNGVWSAIRSNGGNLVVGAQTVRYRRELSLGQKFTLETRLICWDNRAFYVEHRFVTENAKTHQRFVNAIVIVKNTVLGVLNPGNIVDKLTVSGGDNTGVAPEIPEDIKQWIDSNHASSKALRQESVAVGS